MLIWAEPSEILTEDQQCDQEVLLALIESFEEEDFELA